MLEAGYPGEALYGSNSACRFRLMDWLFTAWHEFSQHFIPGITAEQWDATRNWITALGGLVALFVALSTYRANARIRRESQARFVYAKVLHYSDIAKDETFGSDSDDLEIQSATFEWIEDPDPYVLGTGSQVRKAVESLGYCRVLVKNGSEELIGPVKIQLADLETERLWPQIAVILPVLEPGESGTAILVWSRPPSGGDSDVTPVIVFRDASGRWWRRIGPHPIEHVHADPENSSVTKSQREAGTLPTGTRGVISKQPRLGLRVLSHRTLRVLRGKSPTP